MGPVAALDPQADGRPSEQTTKFLAARARGGVGMVIVGNTIATKRGFDESPYKPLLRLDLEEYLPELKRVAEDVHEAGAAIIGEAMAAFGRMGRPTKTRPSIAASPMPVIIPKEAFPDGVIIPIDMVMPTPREATIEEIHQLEKDTVDASLRLQRAGWDGVEIPAHMSYLTSSFLSPRTNWRKDEYGGSVENRARMLVNIVREIRAKAGPDFVIGLRITGNDYLADGQKPEVYAEIAGIVEQAGLDYVAVSEGTYETMNTSLPMVDGTILDYGTAAAFRKAVKGKLLLQGFHDPAYAAWAIEQGYADLIMLVRPLLADPDFVNKLKAGKPETIIRCDHSHYCIRRMFFHMPMRCSSNPRTGRECCTPGQMPSLKRILAAALEGLIMALTGSKILMGLIKFVFSVGRRRRPDLPVRI
jgi:2,4-dienoyl-CoA reductase (NADPH2)